MSKKIKALFVDHYVNGETQISNIEIDNDLKAYYDKLECRNIEMPRVGKYDLICDGEGLLTMDGVAQEKGYVGVSVFDNGLQIVGNFLVVQSDEYGETVSVDDLGEATQYMLDHSRPGKIPAK